jgi:hypothetical protein
VRHPVAEQVAAAFRNDGEPVLRVLLELGALEGIELIADENGDGHDGPPRLLHRHCERSDDLRKRFAFVAGNDGAGF